MEFLLLWWDDLDDFAHACRHLVTSALSEFVESSSLVTGLSAACTWVLLRFQA